MGKERLIESERRFIASMSPDAEAKRLAPTLAEVGGEIVRGARTDTERELAELDAFRIERAAELLRILTTEVFRLRECIKHHRDGRMDSRDLWKIPDNWNSP